MSTVFKTFEDVLITHTKDLIVGGTLLGIKCRQKDYEAKGSYLLVHVLHGP